MPAPPSLMCPLLSVGIVPALLAAGVSIGPADVLKPLAATEMSPNTTVGPARLSGKGGGVEDGDVGGLVGVLTTLASLMIDMSIVATDAAPRISAMVMDAGEADIVALLSNPAAKTETPKPSGPAGAV